MLKRGVQTQYEKIKEGVKAQTLMFGVGSEKKLINPAQKNHRWSLAEPENKGGTNVNRLVRSEEEARGQES
jgi:hypothetical protein